jgi:hypothetical protein
MELHTGCWFSLQQASVKCCIHRHSLGSAPTGVADFASFAEIELHRACRRTQSICTGFDRPQFGSIWFWAGIVRLGFWVSGSASGVQLASTRFRLFDALEQLKGCLFLAFRHFFISFQEIQKLDGPQNEKLM